MKIYFDNIVFNLQRAGGISVYWSELVKRFACSDHDVTFIEQGCDVSNIFRKQIDLSQSRIEYKRTIPTKISRYLPVRLKLDVPSIFHSSYYRVCGNPNVVNVITVYDFIYEIFGSGLKQKLHHLQKKHALHNADAIICISESTRTDLLRLHPYIPPNKVKVIYIAAGDGFIPINKEQPLTGANEHILQRKFILYVGNRSNYKNFDVVVSAVSQLNDLSLVAVGGGELTAVENRNLSQISSRFFHIKSPSSTELNILYNYAFCLLYPSSYEGFGIPIAEAMKAGCPVITSSLSSIPEVAGNAGLMIDSICTDEIINKINTLNDGAYRNKVIELGLVQGNSFSWDRCYRETQGCYEQALRDNRKYN